MWEAKQRRLRSVLTIGPNRAARLGALLSPADRAEYERLLREQRCGVRWLVAWLAERGHPVSPGTVRAHREQFLLSLLEAHESTRLAAAFADAARGRSPAALAEAAAGRTEQLFAEMLFRMTPEERGALTVKDWLELQKASGGLVEGRNTIERMRAESEHRARRAADAAGRTPADRYREVANRVREILGVPLGDEDEEEAAGGRIG